MIMEAFPATGTDSTRDRIGCSLRRLRPGSRVRLKLESPTSSQQLAFLSMAGIASLRGIEITVGTGGGGINIGPTQGRQPVPELVASRQGAKLGGKTWTRTAKTRNQPTST